MSRLLYSLLWYLLLPAIIVRQAWRGRGNPVARGSLRQRLGFVQPRATGAVWLHCVSVGETVAAEPLVAALLAQEVPLLLTSTTYTGAARVRSRFGDTVDHAWMPFDTPMAVARFLDHVRPRLLVILETELWPNLLQACAQRRIPVVLVNARLSERSARGYARFGAVTRPMLANLSMIAAQGDADARRFLSLGIDASRVQVTGNLKFDMPDSVAKPDVSSALRDRIGARPAWIAASTHAGEDDAVLDAHRAVLRDFPDALLVLVPRHPERFDAVAADIAHHGFTFARRSRNETPVATHAVYLCDTMGEMPLLYGIVDAAFVGGSLVDVGGHNFIEPAQIGLPLLTGPHHFNFQAIADDLVAAGALSVVQDAETLGQAVRELLADPGRRERAGFAARDYVARNRGACERTVAVLQSWLPPVVVATR